MLPSHRLLLILSWLFICVSDQPTGISSNDLVLFIFRLTGQDTQYLDTVAGRHTQNGVFDQEGYYKEIQQNNQGLHSRMEIFRKIYREIEAENQEASGFIDHLMVTARQARHGEIRQPDETNTILVKFETLSRNAREYLFRKFSQLKIIDQMVTGKSPLWTATFTVRPSTLSPTAEIATTTTPRVVNQTIQEMRTLLEGVLKRMEDNNNLVNKFLGYNADIFQPAVDNLRKLLQLPLPWNFKQVFEDFGRAVQTLISHCGYLDLRCEEATNISGIALEELLTIAVKTNPLNSRLKALRDRYNREISLKLLQRSSIPKYANEASDLS